MPYDLFFSTHLNALKQEGRYRIFNDLERLVGEAPVALWHHEGHTKPVTVWCTNDYLNMTQHPIIMDAACASVQRYGVGSGGTRNISGTAHAHVLLEKEMAALHEKEAALIFSSGYTANEATLSALGGHLPHCLFISDEKNHASIIQGIRNSRADKVVFRHNDMADLEKKLQSNHPSKVVVVTSVYSMDGDFAPLDRITALCAQYKALLFLDEVHAVGMYGPHGAGLASALGLSDKIDIIQGNFAKAFGVIGGYIAGKESLIDFVRSTASGFIFTTSIPPAIADSARASVFFLKEDEDYRAHFWRNVSILKEKLSATKLPVLPNESHIIPVRVGDARRCRLMSDYLLEKHGIYVQPINYPTVPRGEERFRITVTPAHTLLHMDQLIAGLHDAFHAIPAEESREQEDAA